MHNRGQFFSYDAIVASAIFLITISLMLVYWWGIDFNSSDRSQRDVVYLSDRLLTPGSPDDWHEGDVLSIGLMESGKPNVIVLEKFMEFRDISEKDYAEPKQIFGTAKEYFVEIIGEDIDCRGNCFLGKEPGDSSDISSVTRLVVFNGRPARIRISLWS